MATSQTTVDLIFNGVDRTSAATQAVLGNLEKFSQKTKDLTQPVADFTMAAAKIEAGVLAAGAAVVGMSVKMAGDFDSSFRQLTTLFDATDTDVKGFRDSIVEFSSTSSKSLEDITGSISAAVGSGVKWSESLDLVKGAEKLAVATRSDLTKTTDVLVSTLNVYGLKTSDVGRVSDIFFKTIADGKIEMNDLADNFALVSPVAKAAGISMEEVSAAIAVLTASGVKPATAIDYLRSAISNIMAPSEGASKLAKELNLDFGEQALKAKGLTGVLADLSAKTGGSSEQMKRLVGDVGGTVAALILAENGAAKLSKGLDSMKQSTGAVADAYKKMAGDFKAESAKVGNAFEAMMVKIGTPLLDESAGIAGAIVNIFNAIGANVEQGQLGGLVKYIESILGDVQITLGNVAKSLPAALEKADFSKFKGGIDVVVQSIKNLFDGIDLTTTDGLTKAINMIGSGFLALSNFVSGAIDSLKPAMAAFASLAEGASGFGEDFGKLAGLISGAIAQINLLVPVVAGLVGVMAVNSTVAFVSNIAKIAPAALAATPAMTGIAAAAGVLYLAYSQVAKEAKDFADAQQKVKEANERGEKVQALATDRIKEFRRATETSVTTLEEAEALIKSGAVVWDEASNYWVKAGSRAAEAAKGIKENTGALDAEEAMLQKYRNAQVLTEFSTKKLVDAQKQHWKYTTELVPITDAATGAITGYEQKLVATAISAEEAAKQTGGAGKSMKEIADDARKAEEAQRKWNEELKKMDHAERLAIIEAQSAITVAQIESDAKKGVAAFESLNAGIDSTADVITKLVGELKGLDGLDKSRVWDIIEEEMKLRQQDFALQKDMIQQQIALMKAKIAAMQKGEAMIKIDGAGLQPHLEAFMWEILRTIQTRVNADGLDMLLGA